VDLILIAVIIYLDDQNFDLILFGSLESSFFVKQNIDVS